MFLRQKSCYPESFRLFWLCWEGISLMVLLWKCGKYLSGIIVKMWEIFCWQYYENVWNSSRHFNHQTHNIWSLDFQWWKMILCWCKSFEWCARCYMYFLANDYLSFIKAGHLPIKLLLWRHKLLWAFGFFEQTVMSVWINNVIVDHCC